MTAYIKRTTQKEIAKAANIGQDFLSHIVRGRRRCPPKVAVRLENITGINRKIWVWGTSTEIRSAVENFCYDISNTSQTADG
jgi:plasmid maintenance system antidote protein VapI